MIIIYIAKYSPLDSGFVPYLIVIGMMLNAAGQNQLEVTNILVVEAST